MCGSLPVNPTSVSYTHLDVYKRQRSPIAPANLVKTCGRCHAGANASFVKYQPHANARNRKLNPALYYVTLFMNLLLIGVLTFFMIHTLLWLIRSRYDQIKARAAKGGKNA